jgi:hypothetical protein
MRRPTNKNTIQAMKIACCKVHSSPYSLNPGVDSNQGSSVLEAETMTTSPRHRAIRIFFLCGSVMPFSVFLLVSVTLDRSHFFQRSFRPSATTLWWTRRRPSASSRLATTRRWLPSDSPTPTSKSGPSVRTSWKRSNRQIHWSVHYLTVIKKTF